MAFLNDLNQMFSIVDPNTGKPTDYFMRLIRDRGQDTITIEQQVTNLTETVTSLEATVASIDGTVFTAGTGLSGGGTLSTDDPITFNLDASINDLSDVDTTTTAPTDGQALVWVAADSLWKPGDVASGGGEWSFVKTYDVAVDGSTSQINISATELGEWDEIEIVGRLGTSASGAIFVRASTDDLATLLTTGHNRIDSTTSGISSSTSSVMAISGDPTSEDKMLSFLIRRVGGSITGVNTNYVQRNLLDTRTRVRTGSDVPDVNSFALIPGSGTIDSGSIKVYKRIRPS